MARKKDEEAAQQQAVAAQAAQAATAPPPAASTVAPAGTSATPTLNPLLAPGTTTNFISSPYGAVTGIVPPGAQQVPPQPAPNALMSAAQNYRDLPPTASPVQRAAARQDYASALNEKARASWEGRAGREYESAMGNREDRMVELMTRDAPPEARAQAMERARADWRSLTPEQQGAKYFGDRGETWQQTAQKASSIPQERARESQFETAAQIDRNFSAAIRDARAGGTDEKGRRTKPDRGLERELRARQVKFRLQEKLVDPSNPKVGLDKDYAMRAAGDRFSRDSGSLLETARQQRVAAREKAPDQTQRQLETTAMEERQKIELEKELQRRRLIGRNLMAAYS